MSYHGDYAPASVVYFKFNTAQFSDGAPVTLAGTPALSVYKDDGTTESTTGITLTVDLDTRTGMHQAKIDTSADGTFYAAGHDFDVIITTGTVGGTSVVGRVVGSFSLNNRSALRPTTAGRTLDVSATGEAGLDWANIGSPTTTVGLTGTTISSSQAVASVTGSVGSIAANGITEASFDTTAGSFIPLGIVDQGTAQSATTTQLVIRAGASFGDNTLKGNIAYIKGSTQGYWQETNVTANVGSTDTLTLDPPLAVAPTGTITYILTGVPAELTTLPDVNVAAITGSTTDATRLATLVSDYSGGFLAATINGIAGTIQTLDSLASKQLKRLQLMVRKDAAIATDNATELSELNANNGTGAGTFDNTTDSEQALRDRGDAAWTTASGFSTFNAATDKVFLGDGAHGGTATVITLERMIGASTTLNQPCVSVTGNGTGEGIYSKGGASASGIHSEGGATSGYGIYALATAAGFDGLQGNATGNGGNGIGAIATGTSGHGLNAAGTGASGIGAAFSGNTVDISLNNSSADTLSAAVLKAGSITATVAPNLDAAISTRAVAGDAMTLTSAGLDAVLIESGITPSASLTNDAGTQLAAINARQALAVSISSLAGVLAGAAGPSTTTKPAGNSGGNTRVTADVDATGRTAVTLKVPT